MLIDNTDNADYFLFKFNLSKINKKRILFLKEFYKKEIKNTTFSEKNLLKILYYNGKQSLIDLIYFEIFKSKKNHFHTNLNENFRFFLDIKIFKLFRSQNFQNYFVLDIKISNITANFY